MFQPPSNSYKDQYDQARFKMTWNMNVMLVILLLLLTEMFLIVEPRYVIYYFSGSLLMAGGLLLMRLKRKFEVIALVTSILAFILVCISIFFVSDAPHFIEPFWLLLITFYAFFVLGTKWGVTFLIAQIIAVSAYLVLFFQTNLVSVAEFPKMNFVSMSIEFSICLLLLGYIVGQFMKAIQNTEVKLKEANNLLWEEKNNVDRQHKEKTALLQEIHHRVKNNLQVIISLLRLQSGKVSSEESKENFQDAINRIMTMALIHQKMYEEENLANIDLKDYFHSLLMDLLESNASNKKIELEVDINIQKIGNKSIVPLALIITELVTNSIKHGFVDKSSGIIGLTLHDESRDKFKMTYFDNGEWNYEKKDSSLGLELMDAFTEQLEGSYSFNVDQGKSEYEFILKKIEEVQL